MLPSNKLHLSEISVHNNENCWYYVLNEWFHGIWYPDLDTGPPKLSHPKCYSVFCMTWLTYIVPWNPCSRAEESIPLKGIYNRNGICCPDLTCLWTIRMTHNSDIYANLKGRWMHCLNLTVRVIPLHINTYLWTALT